MLAGVRYAGSEETTGLAPLAVTFSSPDDGRHCNEGRHVTDPTTFLYDHWYAAALSSDIGEAPFARTICDEEIVFFRTSGGQVAALEDRCAHRHAPLSLGVVTGDHIQCGYHGMTFGADGACLRVPGQQTPPPTCVRAYPVEERDGWVWLWIGDPAKADASTIPSLPYFGVPEWAGFQKYFHVKAGCQLFVDNLLDLSHVAFTHAASIGAASAADADAHVAVSVEEDCVRGERSLDGVEPGPFIKAWGGFEGTIKRHSTYVWRPPSVMDICSRFSDPDGAITIMVINPITPETSTTAHFWIGWARDFKLDDSAETEKAIEQNTQVILEDVRIIEGQQLRMSKYPDVPAVPIGADKAVIAVHRFLDRLHADQQSSQQDVGAAE
jgi:phenylpropionate dioxygenase-like ring-hydroxylating dioxygenase large terminal subunit